jgi:hypothetical protein
MSLEKRSTPDPLLFSNSRRFQAFLDRRMKRAGWTPLSEIEREIADDLKK